MQTEVEYCTVVSYRDDEDNEINEFLLTVKATDEKSARRAARAEAAAMLEEGVAFRVTSVRSKEECHWGLLREVMQPEDIIGLRATLDKPISAATDIAEFNRYLDTLERRGPPHAVELHDSEAGVMVKWASIVHW